MSSHFLVVVVWWPAISARWPFLHDPGSYPPENYHIPPNGRRKINSKVANSKIYVIVVRKVNPMQLSFDFKSPTRWAPTFSYKRNKITPIGRIISPQWNPFLTRPFIGALYIPMSLRTELTTGPPSLVVLVGSAHQSEPSVIDVRFDRTKRSPQRNNRLNCNHIGCFLKWWVSPTTMGFPTKNDQHLGCEMGVPPFEETPPFSSD